MTGSTSNNTTARQAETQIRQLIDNWSRALEAKDVDGLVADYASDAVLYDAIPPYKQVGPAGIRKTWESCLPYFPASFRSEHRDLVVHVDGDVAFVYGLHRCIPDESDHPCGQTWMRFTGGYRRLDGQWKVVHAHVSIPFNPMNNQAWQIDDPDALTAPDYSQACPAPEEGKGA